MRWFCFILLFVCLGNYSNVIAEEEANIISLFNGKDLSGWEIMGQPEGWRIEDGCIHSDGGKGGDWIRTEKQYANYIFHVEWMLSEVGNSGALIRTGEKTAWGPGFEVQMLAPWTPHRDDLHCTGSLYSHVAVQNRPDETPPLAHDGNYL
jgi:hypothetical protein